MFNKEDWSVRHEDGSRHFVIPFPLNYVFIAVVLVAVAAALYAMEEYRLWPYAIVFAAGWAFGRFDQRWSDRRQAKKS